MNNIKFLAAMVVVILFAVQCADEDRLPLVVLDTVEKGAYPRLIDQTDKLLNLFDIDGSVYTYNVEFVDEEGGNLVEEYVVDLYFDDNNPDNGDNSGGPFEVVKFDASDFTDGANGYKQAPTVSISGTQALAAAGLSPDDVKAGDNFNFRGRINLTDGRTFSQDNSSATVVGPAFLGHFNYTMPAACPSDLTGTYNFTNDATFCGTPDAGGTVEIIARGGGVYGLSDWSLGAYNICYGGFVPAGWGSLSFTEVCAEVSFTGFVDNYGDAWTFDSSIDGENWVITWENTYGESGSSTIVFPGGVPFTLAE